jgi:hypothetical protein
MWIYDQQTGILSDGTRQMQCYSGHGPGLNNPALENVHDVGPIPAGIYTIGSFFNDDEKGPFVCNLIPVESNIMYGRAGFMIHGDNRDANQTASHGCIVAPHAVRVAVQSSGDNTLQVI